MSALPMGLYAVSDLRGMARPLSAATDRVSKERRTNTLRLCKCMLSLVAYGDLTVQKNTCFRCGTGDVRQSDGVCHTCPHDMDVSPPKCSYALKGKRYVVRGIGDTCPEMSTSFGTRLRIGTTTTRIDGVCTRGAVSPPGRPSKASGYLSGLIDVRARGQSGYMRVRGRQRPAHGIVTHLGRRWMSLSTHVDQL